MGSSIFNKLFRRKSKPEALHLSNSSLSTPTNQNGAVLASSKNKRNILGRKKKANKAAFPTFSNSSSDKKGNNGKKKPLANHAEKENAPRQYDVPNGQYVAPLDNRQAPFDQHQSMSYTKPTLSLIKEEASPRNGEYVSPVPTPTSASGSRGNNQQQQHMHQQMLSPMSGSKPPLTPNRLRGQSERRPPHADYLNATTNHHYNNSYPSLTDEPLSPASLRGQQILSPHSMASSNDMCLSHDAEDEEYNRIAFNGAHNISNGNQNGFYDGAAFPGDKDPFSSSALPMPQSSFAAPQESQDDLRAWTPSPTKKASFTFTDKMLSPSAIGGQHRHAEKKSKVVFENFADFEPFVPNEQFTSRSKNSSSRSVTNQHNISPVGGMLEDSKFKRSVSGRGMDGSVGNGSHGQHQHRSSSSFNSAPVITPSYVRSHVARSKINNSASISKVIDNLELHVNKRQGSNASSTGHYVSKDFVSEASSRDSRRSAESAIRDAKERIRRENMINNESKIIDILANGGSGAQAVAVMNAKSGDNNWLFDEVTGTLGPRSHAADLESLGGRSNRSGKSKSSMGNKSHRSHKSKTSRGHHRHRSRNDGDVSVDSRTSRNSRNSYRSYQTTKSMVSQMSQESRSVANDLLRLEAQLSMVGKSRSGASNGGGSSVVAELNKRRDDCGMTVTSRDFSVSRSSSGVPRPKGSRHVSAMARKAAARSMQSKVSVIAPPGKLGIILANRTDSRGTVVSGVRTSSVLADKVSPGDRIIAIDDEDVSQMNVKEITTIMARKSEFERVLSLYAAPKQQYD